MQNNVPGHAKMSVLDTPRIHSICKGGQQCTFATVHNAYRSYKAPNVDKHVRPNPL